MHSGGIERPLYCLMMCVCDIIYAMSQNPPVVAYAYLVHPAREEMGVMQVCSVGCMTALGVFAYTMSGRVCVASYDILEHGSEHQARTYAERHCASMRSGEYV